MIEAFNLHWNVGEPWGVAHPKHTCYADASQVTLRNGQLRLGVSFKPQQHHDRKYLWAIGKVYSRETMKFGTLDVYFQLPLGRNLWPAIWLYDTEAWPPEIDVMEGWSGQGLWPLKHRSDYLRLPWCHYIHPGLVHPSATMGGSYGTCGDKAVWRCQIDGRGTNHCRLIWTPDEIMVEYNGHVVMRENNPDVLRPFNESKGMIIVLNNYVTNDFMHDDYTDLVRPEFVIHDLTYKPL